MSTDGAPILREILARLDGVLPCDRRELRARIGGLEKRLRDGKAPDDRALAVVQQAVERSIHERLRRRGLVPAVAYPPELPVTAALPAIRSALASAQVVVVAGETGSGKSTQLPKLCLELGRGVDGRIAHTQPRRIAARSIARRVAEELGVPVGGVVGVKVRFGDETGRDTLLKVLTDGMLLAETRGDPRLDAYDTVIVDEAHERSLNIDFLLGYLRRLLPRRPDLKVVLTSATIDVERLSAHFGGCPIVEVPGRGFPIETRYRPLESAGIDEEDPRMLEAIARAIDEVDESFAPALVPDVLVFLSGEREIREVAEHLEGHFRRASGPARAATEVVPLFARQAIEEQERVFSPGKRRRIVLATNVAETSLTVPRIHAVVDPGFARILRYSARSRVQRLPVEEISQASARQRSGRAGRLGPGIAVRLYSEEDFAARAAFTQPEILRTNLASVILQMEALSLGKAEEFPFVDPPSARLLADGRATLVELGASTAEGRLTQLGRQMSLLPLDPRLSRMLLASVAERSTNAALVLAAALAVQDPRIRPQEKRDAADLAHVRFRDAQSDFVSFLRIWQAWRHDTRDLGSSARRRWCEKNYLSHQRMREWSDVVSQLRELCAEHFSIRAGEPFGADGQAELDQGALHRAVLAGFATQIGMRTEKGEYRSPAGALFTLHPSSALARRGPNWVVAAEIVETTRRFARICARIQPEWIVRVAPHLCARSQFEPHFVEESGQVAAFERTGFGELVVVPKRRVPFGPVDPVGARQVFIQEALVGHRLRTDAPFLRENRALRAALEEEEIRGRRRGAVLEEMAAYAFYDARLPAEIHSGPSLDRWRRDAERRDPSALVMRDEDLVRDGARRVDPTEFPQRFEAAGLSLPLDYAQREELDDDGITVRVPVEALAVLDPAPFEWLVPGLLAEKVEALVRSLPKHLRVRLFPIEEVVAGACEMLLAQKAEGRARSLRAALARHLEGVAQCPVAAGDFRDELLPKHLAMRFAVLDADGSVLATGRDLAALTARFAGIAGDRLRAAIDPASDLVAQLERDEVEALPDEPLAATLSFRRAGIELTGYPALVVEREALEGGPRDGTRGESSGNRTDPTREARAGSAGRSVFGRAVRERVALRVLDSAYTAHHAHPAAVGVLAARELRDAVEHHVAYDALCEDLVARADRWQGPLPGALDAVDLVARLVAAQAIAEAPRAPRSATELAAVVRAAGRDLHERASIALRTVHAVLGEGLEVLGRLRDVDPDPSGSPRERVLARLYEVLPPANLAGIAPCDRDELAQRLRLATMLRMRLDRLRETGAAKDREIDDEIADLRARVRSARSERGRSVESIDALRRMFEEIEISRFAPKLPRRFAASERRLLELLDAR